MKNDGRPNWTSVHVNEPWIDPKDLRVTKFKQSYQDSLFHKVVLILHGHVFSIFADFSISFVLKALLLKYVMQMWDGEEKWKK